MTAPLVQHGVVATQNVANALYATHTSNTGRGQDVTLVRRARLGGQSGDRYVANRESTQCCLASAAHHHLVTLPLPQQRHHGLLCPVHLRPGSHPVLYHRGAVPLPHPMERWRERKPPPLVRPAAGRPVQPC